MSSISFYGTAVFSLSLQPVYNLLVPLWALRLGASPLAVGAVVGAASVLPLFLAVPMGNLTDRHGARRVILWSAVAMTGLAVLYPAVRSVAWLFAMQVAAGPFQSLAWIGAQTYAANAAPTADMHRAMGRYSFAANLGVAGGPFVVGWMAQRSSFPAAYLLAAAWALALAVCAWAAPHLEAESAVAGAGTVRSDGPTQLRDGSTERGDGSTERGDGSTERGDGSTERGGGSTQRGGGSTQRGHGPVPGGLQRMLRLAAIPAVTLVLGGTFVRLGIYGMRSSVYPIALTEMGVSTFGIAILNSASSACSTCSALTIGWLTRFIPAHRLLQLGLAVSVVSIALTPAVHGMRMLLLLGALSGASIGLTLPLLMSILAAATPPAERGLAISLRQVVNRLCTAAVPFGMGVLARMDGVGSSFYLGGGALLALVGALAVVFRGHPGRGRLGRLSGTAV